MANDETPFRQERKPISKNELQNSLTPPSLKNVEATRQAAAQEIGEEVQARSDVAPFEIKGKNIPQEFLNRINNFSEPESEYESPVQESRMKQPPKRETPNMRVTGSSKLEELLGGISSNFEKIQLPSLGRFYDGQNGPTDGIIHIRPMTGEEEKILATPRFIKSGTAIDKIFNNCMKEKYDSTNFLTVDRTYLLIWLRGISYTSEYEVQVTCPFTDKPFPTVINLDLDVEQCPDELNGRPYDKNNLIGVLPTTQYNFSYRLACGSDEQKIQDYREKKTKFDTSNQADDTLLYRTALLVEDIEGLTNKHEIKTLLQKLPISDVSHLRNVTSEPPFGVNTKITITSPFTMEEFEVELPLDANFFFPRQRKIQNPA